MRLQKRIFGTLLKQLETLSKNQRRAIAIICVVGFLLFGWLFFRSPDFPDTIPSAEQVEAQVAEAQRQEDFFNRLTRHLRVNHGGILLTGAKSLGITIVPTLPADSIKTYFQRYKFFDSKLILTLTEDFARSEQIALTVNSSCHRQSEEIDCYEFDFLEEERIWVRVQMEVKKDPSSNSAVSILPEYVADPRLKQADSLPEPVELPDQETMAITEARLVIVIDDFGYRMDMFYDFLSLDYDIVFSVLPLLPYSAEIAELAMRYNREVILHLPMQPKEWPGLNPGEGALMLDDTPAMIMEKMTANLKTVPHAIGVNNHMGSAFTTYSEGLDVMMKVLKKHNLFFLDSKTAPGPTARNSARRHQVRYLARDVFLDNDRTVEDTRAQLFKAARLAKQTGRVIAIGHCYPTTHMTLATYLPELERDHIKITRIDALLAE
jgi:polysaccharide deacetylase 2 family uncharacterized protein YibQ